MKRFVLILFLVVGGMLSGMEPVPRNAVAMLEAFAGNKPINIQEVANAQMAAALGGDKFSQLCRSTVMQYGAFVRWEGAPSVKRVQEGKNSYRQVFRTAEFAGGRLSVLCAIEEKSGKVAGFFLKPLPAGKQQADKRFREEELSFGSTWKLSGTLTLPEKRESYPVVLLIHGSGPHDRDETVGPNKPFAEIAAGLAGRGIAVFRYDKRTLIYKDTIGRDITLNEEVVDDAVAVLKMLREKFPSAPIFVLGHSLGGMLLPRIAAQTTIPAGYIFMAAPARNFDAVIDEQLQYVVSLQDWSDEKKRSMFESFRNEMRQMMSRQYYDDLMSLNQVEGAKKISVPMLFLQGGRDYQSTPEDLKIWQENLKDKAEFRLYPDLNHLMQSGQGKAIPAEYFQRAPFADKVIDDIAGFVR